MHCMGLEDVPEIRTFLADSIGASRNKPAQRPDIILNRIRNRVNYVLPSGNGFHQRMVRLKGTKVGDQPVFQRPQTVKDPVVKILLPQLVPEVLLRIQFRRIGWQKEQA